MRTTTAPPLDGQTKGLPAGFGATDPALLGSKGFYVLAEDLPLSLALLKDSALRHNSAWMRAVCVTLAKPPFVPEAITMRPIMTDSGDSATEGSRRAHGDAYVPAADSSTLSAPIDLHEWKLRLRLAAAYRAIDHFGWSELTANHLTLRVRQDPPEFLINPYGLLYSEVTASNLVRIDLDGKVLTPTEYPINPAGFNIHAAIHAARPDAHCVMHVHTVAGMTVSCLRDGLLPLTLEGTDFHNRIGYHDFEGPSLAVDERARLAASLGDNIALILRNHGLVTIGETVDSAFLRMYRLILACEVQLKAMMTGQALIRISDDTLEKSAQRHDWFFRIGPGGRQVGHGELDFSAVMRLMAKIDPTCLT